MAPLLTLKFRPPGLPLLALYQSYQTSSVSYGLKNKQCEHMNFCMAPMKLSGKHLLYLDTIM